MMMHQKPTVFIPPWSSLFDDASPIAGGASYDPYEGSDDGGGDLSDSAIDAYSCDEFRMYEFKIRRCARGRSHDWTECPYAHPGEKARRRDPRKFHYSGVACPEFRKGSCKRGDTCDMAHGVFECWLHPARYRTQPCKDGTSCRRRVCFFAHTPEQLRVLPQSPKTPLESYDGSPLRQQQQQQQQQQMLFATSSPPESPPMSPEAAAVRRASWPVNEVLASLRKLQLEKARSFPAGVGFGSPRSATPSAGGCGGGDGGFRGGFCSLPATPTRVLGGFDGGFGEEEEGHVERVESGRALRAKMYERLSKESSLEKEAPIGSGPGPDVGWVSELVK